jgi:uncharacterized protein YegJ (DUF2314 family)
MRQITLFGPLNQMHWQKSLLLAGALLLAFTSCSRADDPVVQVQASDPEMNAAIAKARQQLPHFWSTFSQPTKGESDFCIKVKIGDKGAVEYFWCVDIQRTGEKITAVVNNDPEIVKCVKLGQRVPVGEAEIADWLYMRDEKMVGNYTLRPLMKTMSKEERSKAEALLGESP